MTYPGFRDFRVEQPGQLRQDLQRWNSLLERAFTDAAAGAAQRWRVIVVVGSTGNATHGDIVQAGKSQAATVVLPRSAPAAAGRAVRVYRAGANSVTVVAASGDTIGGSASVTLGSNAFSEFVDDGAGTWMPNA